MQTDSPERGRLIVFEGIDGTGKSTQIKLLAEYLQARGIEVVSSFEPTRGPWGMKVRQAAMANERLSMEEEIDCLLQDRREHVKELIEPALARGAWVLLDRYYLSMMAYQGATGANIEQIREANEDFAPVPDMALWLDISLEESFARMDARGLARDAFENEDFQSKVMNIYSHMEMPWLYRVDASDSISMVQERVRELVRHYLTTQL